MGLENIYPSQAQFEVAVLEDFLKKTHGENLVILSQKDTHALHKTKKTGSLRTSQGKERKVTHHKVRAQMYSLDAIRQNDTIRNKALQAFYHGRLGVTLGTKKYAFTQASHEILLTAGIKTLQFTPQASSKLKHESTASLSKQEDVFSTIPSHIYAEISSQLKYKPLKKSAPIDQKRLEKLLEHSKINKKEGDVLLNCAHLDEASLNGMLRHGRINKSTYFTVLEHIDSTGRR